MITKKQFVELNSLKREQGRLKDLKDKFTDQHVWLDVGIVEINGASRNDPRLNADKARLFHNEFTELKERFKKALLEDLDIKIKDIENKMSLYLSDE